MQYMVEVSSVIKEKVTTYAFERNFPYIYQDIRMRVIEETYTVLRREDCELMINTKRCGRDHKMSCDGDGCFGSFPPERNGTESFWGTVTRKGYTCWISNRVITDDSAETRIFHSVTQLCKAIDLECSMVDSIIIWNRHIIHRCQYELIDTFEFEVGAQNRLTSDTLLFQVNDHFMKCNITIYSTNEGVF